MNSNIVKRTIKLDFVWHTQDPFLFCVHHLDTFPPGNEFLGPDPNLLRGRNIGNDFTPKDGWRMYHGDSVPGFPAHPHRGFETITIVLQGTVDHFDSHGQTGRYSNGDVQWMTAGRGLQHSEMFPLLNRNGTNVTELFQIWLNLPRSKKMADPHFKMMWAEEIPVLKNTDENGFTSSVRIITGSFDTVESMAPAPDSWASEKDNNVQIWILEVEEGGKFEIPSTISDVNRTIYLYEGELININKVQYEKNTALELFSDGPVSVHARKGTTKILLLQARPINEPVVQYGPFVMNTPEEIQQTYREFQKTQFGGWQWNNYAPVHSAEIGRMAKHADGKIERK